MNLIKASCGDFEKLTLFYSCAIKNTENMEIYAKWVYGKHPTDEMIMRYISEGALYFCERNGSVISAAAVHKQVQQNYIAAVAASVAAVTSAAATIVASAAATAHQQNEPDDVVASAITVKHSYFLPSRIFLSLE